MLGLPYTATNFALLDQRSSDETPPSARLLSLGHLLFWSFLKTRSSLSVRTASLVLSGAKARPTTFLPASTLLMLGSFWKPMAIVTTLSRAAYAHVLPCTERASGALSSRLGASVSGSSMSRRVL